MTVSRRAARAHRPARRKVVVTGLGALTPSGHTMTDTWQSVLAGHSGITELTGAEFAPLRVRIGGQVRGFAANRLLPEAEARRLAPVLLWAIAAADEAMAQGNPRIPSGSEFGFSIIAATGSGPIAAMQRATRTLDHDGPRQVPPALAMHGAPDAAASLLSQRYGALGEASAVSATCASGALALGEGMRRIRHGDADTVLVVGYEDCLNPVNLAANANMRALARGYEHDPARASRPFDRERNGFVMSQGAAAVLLEAADVVRAEGRTPLAELAGFGAASDAYHATAPHPAGRGAIAAMQACLVDARIRPSEVTHVNAHGTGTPLNDRVETRALDAVFGAKLSELPITATKSSTGHLLGASGVLEAALAVCTLRDQLLPPTINLDHCEFPELRVVTEATRGNLVSVLSNSFGFGGQNGTLLLRTANDEELT